MLYILLNSRLSAYNYSIRLKRIFNNPKGFWAFESGAHRLFLTTVRSIRNSKYSNVSEAADGGKIEYSAKDNLQEIGLWAILIEKAG